jgi:hypothetical protein
MTPYEQTMREQKLFDALCGQDLQGKPTGKSFEEAWEEIFKYNK